jgi:hypothetical protein
MMQQLNSRLIKNLIGGFILVQSKPLYVITDDVFNGFI